MTEPTKGLRIMLANPTHDPGHVLFDAPGKKGQIPTTQEAQANVAYINRLIEEDERGEVATMREENSALRHALRRLADDAVATANNLARIAGVHEKEKK